MNNNNFPQNPNFQMQSAMQMNQVLPVPTMPPQTLPQVQIPNLPNVIPLPITVRITSSPTNCDTDGKTDQEMLEGKVIRTTFNCNVMSVAAFMRAYLVTKKPHHLLDLIHIHWNDEKSSSSKGKGGAVNKAGILGTVGIRFGDGVNDFTVIVKDEGTNSSNSTSSGSPKKTDLVLSLFLKEGDKKVPAMLDPTGKLIAALYKWKKHATLSYLLMRIETISIETDIMTSSQSFFLCCLTSLSSWFNR